MFAFLLTLLILDALLLSVVVLLQAGQGGGLASLGGATTDTVLGGRQAVALKPKAFDVLAHLVRNAGRLVTQDELIEAVWPDTIVGDSSLKSCVRQVRRALGDRVRKPQFIETVHRRGYRFIAPVGAGGSPPGGSRPRPRGARRRPGPGP